MHIKFNRSLRGDYGRARVGDVKLVEKDVAKSLIERGLAVEVSAPAGAAKSDDDKLSPAQRAAKADKAKPGADA